LKLRWVGKVALANLAPKSVYFLVNAHAAAREIASRQRWEPEIDNLSTFVRSGDVVIDVGANHGLYTYHLSHLVGPAGRVHSFEPLPPNLRILAYTIKRHELSNVTVHPHGCGVNAELTNFCVPLQRGVPMLWIARQGCDGLKFICELVRLDDVITEKVSLIKIDVEGAELFVLQGAQRILSESRPVVLFEALNNTVDYRYEQQLVFQFLSSFDYTFLFRAGSGDDLVPVEGFTEVGNYFAIPNER
jgi:FkbM family methyltransferase